jgi:hypothetical protein
MDNLYNARGKLKIDLVKRVVNKFKREKAEWSLLYHLKSFNVCN